MDLLLYLIIGGLIGWFAGVILGKDVPGGIIGNILAGIIGAWIGKELEFFHFGPYIAGIQIIPALIGAVIFIFLLSLMRKIIKR